jgi:hypothetical protein
MVDIRRTNSPTTVELNGEIAGDLVRYAQHKITAVLRHTALPVLRVAVVVTRHPDPARDRPVTAHVNVDLNGRLVRVRTDAATPREAVDQLVDGLRSRLERLGSGWRYRRGHRDRVSVAAGPAHEVPIEVLTEEA